MKENNSRFNLGEKIIETPSLFIQQNLMMWDSTMIQLSNISYISATDIASTPFPVVAALLILAGLFLFKATVVGALLLIVIGGAWIFHWYKENEKRRQGAILTIRMNSGHNLLFTFQNKVFLMKVLKVLENIIVDGCDSQVSVNISNCTITGNARVLEGANL